MTPLVRLDFGITYYYQMLQSSHEFPERGAKMGQQAKSIMN